MHYSNDYALPNRPITGIDGHHELLSGRNRAQSHPLIQKPYFWLDLDKGFLGHQVSGVC